MSKVYTYDWKADISEFFEDLENDWQGKVCYFYQYDTQGDEYAFIVSEQLMTEEQIKQRMEEFYNQE